MVKIIKSTCLALMVSSIVFTSAFSDENKVTKEVMVAEKTTIEQEIENEKIKLEAAKERMKVAESMLEHVTTQETLEKTISSLATQMMQNNKFTNNKPVVITSFVRLDNLKKTTEFGRIIGESLINELSNRNFNVIEFRGQLAISVNEEGEYYISRNVNKLKKRIEDTFVVVGTYSRQFEKIMVNARVIDNENGRIISSARATYAHGLKNDCVIFKDCKPPRTISIVKE